MNKSNTKGTVSPTTLLIFFTKSTFQFWTTENNQGMHCAELASFTYQKVGRNSCLQSDTDWQRHWVYGIVYNLCTVKLLHPCCPHDEVSRAQRSVSDSLRMLYYDVKESRNWPELRLKGAQSLFKVILKNKYISWMNIE